MREFNLFLKRLIDLTGSGLGLTILSPVFVITITIIKVTMPGPVFFVQERVGKDKKLLNLIKFRTMKVDKEAEKGFDFSKDKERITTIGKLLRRLKIDELPQLISVFKGDMSLVGPRPTILQQVESYSTHQLKRLSMKPGLTGLAQVNGNTSLPWERRIEYDLEYVNKFNVFLDIKIIFKTLAIVILGEERFKREEDVLS